MSTPTHLEYPEQVKKAEARGVEPAHARQIVDEAARQARKQVFESEFMGLRTIAKRDLDTGQPLPPDGPSDLCDFEADLEMKRKIRVGELVDRAIAGELAGGKSQMG